MTSVLRSFASNKDMSQKDLSSLSTYTITKYDAQNQLYYRGSTTINITLPSKITAKWNSFPIIYLANMSLLSGSLMTFHLDTNVRVKAPDNENYTSSFSLRGGFNGYLLYVGDDQWMLQGVGANVV
jgi:hypothetical protein